MRLPSDTHAKFLGLLTAAAIEHAAIDLPRSAKELGVPESTLMTWANNHKKSKDSEAIEQLLELNHTIDNEMLSQEAEKAAEDESGLRTEIIDGKIVVINKEEDRANAMKTVQSAKLGAMKEGLVGLELLNIELQDTATTLVSRITELASGEPSARDVSNLTTALTNIQNAFFNKPTTNIQVNTVTGGGETLLNKFRGNLQA